MKKSKLLTLLSKYSLNGKTTEPILWKWDDEDECLKVTFKTDNLDVLGLVSFRDFNIGTFTELGVTSQLAKILTALDDNVDITIQYERNKPVALSIDDNSSTARFVLVDTSLERFEHQRNFGLKTTFEPIVEFDFDKETANRFVKSSSALSDSKHFAFQRAGDSVQFILNYTTDYQANQIQFTVGAEIKDDFDVMMFNSENFREIINSNKDCITASIAFAANGLLRIQFEGDDYTSQYYLVKLDN